MILWLFSILLAAALLALLGWGVVWWLALSD